jgi:hypothetical protein
MSGELSARRGKRLAAAIVVVLAMWIDHCRSGVPDARPAAPASPPVTAAVAPPPGVAPAPPPGVVMCRLPKH